MLLASLPTPSEMMTHLDTRVRGQRQAKRDLAVAFYEHYSGLASGEVPELGGPPHARQHVLLLGPSGCGKTYLVKTLCSHLRIPMAFWSATSMSESGYVGDDVDEPLKNLLRQTHGDLTRAHRGVVVLDEIDKIRIAHTSERDVSGEGVQNGLLTLLDGRRVTLRERNGEPMGEMDTSQLLFVCLGAFVDLPALVRKRLAGPAPLGLNTPPRAAAQTLTNDDAYARATPEDLIAYGLLPEFVGRFPNVTAVHALSVADLIGLLCDVEGSAVDRMTRGYAAHGLELRIEEDALCAVAERAQARGTGARGLDNTIGDALRDCTWRRHELADEGVQCVVVTREAALGEAPPRLERGPAPTSTRVADQLRAMAFGASAQAAAARAAVDAGLAPRHRVRVPAPRPPAAMDPLQQGLPLEIAPPSAPAPRPRAAEPREERETRQRLLVLRAKDLQAGKASAEARAWWERFETERPLALVLHVAEELAARGVTLERFVELVQRSGTLGVHANLRWLDYVRERDAFERSRELLALVQRDVPADPAQTPRVVRELEAVALPPLPASS